MYIYSVFYGLLSANKSFQSINQSNLTKSVCSSSASSSTARLVMKPWRCLVLHSGHLVTSLRQLRQNVCSHGRITGTWFLLSYFSRHIVQQTRSSSPAEDFAVAVCLGLAARSATCESINLILTQGNIILSIHMLQKLKFCTLNVGKVVINYLTYDWQ